MLEKDANEPGGISFSDFSLMTTIVFQEYPIARDWRRTAKSPRSCRHDPRGSRVRGRHSSNICKSSRTEQKVAHHRRSSSNFQGPPNCSFTPYCPSRKKAKVRIVERHNIIQSGGFPRTREWKTACRHVQEAIQATDWPHGSGRFTIYPESGKKRGEGNGVLPIKIPCIRKLVELGWRAERLPKIKKGVLRTGDLDALYESRAGYIGFEWETGNISSSHRAINKLLLTLYMGGIVGGFLVVPSDRLKVYLTDRIGNIGELKPYFPLWRVTRIREGALKILAVEHDAESRTVPKIPKTTAGRALG